MKRLLVLALLILILFCYADPDWEVVVYTNSTIAYCEVTIDEIPATESDLVGAFIEDECRGIGEIFLFEGISYTTLSIQGDIPETVAFLVWDQSIDTICDVEYTTTTSPGGDIGYPPDYLHIDAYSGNPINHYPVFTPPQSITFPEDIPTTYDFSEFCFDEDGDELFMDMADNEYIFCEFNGLMGTFTTTPNFHGTRDITFILSDGQLIDAEFIEVIVCPVNDAPQILGTIPPQGNVELELNDRLNVSIDAEDVDSWLDYVWYLDSEELWQTSDSVSIVFTELGEFELTCTISDEDHNLYTAWNISVTEVPVTANQVDDDIYIEIYPNPCGDNLWVTTNSRSSFSGLALYNIKGAKLASYSIGTEGPEQMIRGLSKYPAGIYFIKADTPEKAIFRKLSIK